MIVSTLALLGAELTRVTPALAGHQATAAVSLADVLRFGNGTFAGLETCKAKALASVLEREREGEAKKNYCKTLIYAVF